MIDPRTVDLATVQLNMTKNGEPAGSGLAGQYLGQTGHIPLRKGEVILSGSLTPLVPVGAGDRIEMTISNLGSASLTFTE